MTLPESALSAAAVCAVVLAPTIALPARRPKRVLRGVAIVLVLVGCMSVHVARATAPRDDLRDFVGDGVRAIEIDGVIQTKIEPAAGGAARFEIDAERVRAGDRELTAAVPLAIWVSAEVLAEIAGRDGMDLGARVTVRGAARETDAGDRAVFIVFATAVVIRSQPPGVWGMAAALRSNFVARAAALPGPGAGLVPGLAVGDTSAVSSTLTEQMRSSSLSHLTAVSGANCAVVVALVFALAGFCRIARWGRILSALFALGCFVVLVTPEPSVIRAAAMSTIALFALALDRSGAGIAVLSVAVSVLLLVDPWLSRSLGFALSAAATAGLLLLARPLAAVLARVLPTPLAVSLSVPAAAQLACGPLLVLIDPVIPAYGIVANLLAGPAAPLATLAGLGACVLGFATPLADALTWLAWLPASWIAGVAAAVARLPGASVAWLEGVVGSVILALMTAALVLALVVRSRRRGVRMVRRAVALVAVAAVGVAAGGVLLERPLATLTAPGDWSVVQCDIGQGDAVLLRSRGEIALIDTGVDEAMLEDCLTRVGVRRVDLLVLTHFDLDHVGAVGAVRGRVGTVMHGPISHAADERIVAGLVRAGARAVQGGAGMTGALGAARWQILWPSAGRSPFAAGNDTSLVLAVERSEDAMPRGLYLGDLSAPAQRALRATGRVRGAFDIVKVAHHGSADQDPRLYAQVGASLAFIGVGRDNDYGHPRAETLGLLRDAETSIVRSDIDGLVTVRRTQEGLAVWREHSG